MITSAAIEYHDWGPTHLINDMEKIGCKETTMIKMDDEWYFDDSVKKVPVLLPCNHVL